MLDPKTKQPQKQLSDPEQDLPFISSSLRKALSLKCSDELKDDPEKIVLMNKTAKDWELAKIKMAEHDKQIEPLEVKKHLEKLQDKFLGFIATWATGLAIDAQIELQVGVLEDDNLGKVTAFNAIRALLSAVFKILGFDDATAATDKLQTKHGFKYRELVVQQSANPLFEDESTRIDQRLSALLTKQLKTVVVECWNKDKEKDKARKVNAKIRERLRSKKEAEATADVRAALDSEGHNG